MKNETLLQSSEGRLTNQTSSAKSAESKSANLTRIPKGVGLEQVARELALFLINISAHTLANILVTALEERRTQSIITRSAYLFGRNVRMNEIDSMIKELRTYDAHAKVVVTYDSSTKINPAHLQSLNKSLHASGKIHFYANETPFVLFDAGGWESTSFNTLFLRQLILNLPDYQHGNGLSHEDIVCIKDNYLKKALESRLEYTAKLADEKEAYESVRLLKLEEENRLLIKQEQMTRLLIDLEKKIVEEEKKSAELEELNRELSELQAKKISLLEQLQQKETKLTIVQSELKLTEIETEEKKQRLQELFPQFNYQAVAPKTPVSKEILIQAERDSVVQFYTTLHHGKNKSEEVLIVGKIENPPLNAEELERQEKERARLKLIQEQDIAKATAERKQNLKKREETEAFDQNKFVNQLEVIMKRLEENNRQQQEILKERQKAQQTTDRLHSFLTNGSVTVIHSSTEARELKKEDFEKYDELIVPLQVAKSLEAETVVLPQDTKSISIGSRQQNFDFAKNSISSFFKNVRSNPPTQLPKTPTKKGSHIAQAAEDMVAPEVVGMRCQ